MSEFMDLELVGYIRTHLGVCALICAVIIYRVLYFIHAVSLNMVTVVRIYRSPKCIWQAGSDGKQGVMASRE
mgnify:CR=1 FL=1